MTAATVDQARPARTIPWRRVAVAALPGGLYLAARILGILAYWGMATINHGVVDLHAWDGDWYLAISAHGYAGVPTDMQDAFGHHHTYTPMVFFPGYPQLVHVLAWMFAGNYVLAGIGVSTATGIAGAFAVARLAERFSGSRRAQIISVVLFATMPMSIVFSMTYPEALLVALTAWALVGIVEHRWWIAGPCVAAAGYVSPMAVPLIAVVIVAAFVDLPKGRASWSAVVALASPLTIIGYVLIWVPNTSHMSYFAIQKAGWGTRLDFGWSTLRWIGKTLTVYDSSYTTLTVLLCLAAAGLLVWARPRMPWPLWVYSLLVLAITLGTGGVMFDKTRLLLAAFPLLLPVASRLASTNTRTMATATTVIALVGLWFSAFSLTGWHYSI